MAATAAQFAVCSLHRSARCFRRRAQPWRGRRRHGEGQLERPRRLLEQQHGLGKCGIPGPRGALLARRTGGSDILAADHLEHEPWFERWRHCRSERAIADRAEHRRARVLPEGQPERPRAFKRDANERRRPRARRRPLRFVGAPARAPGRSRRGSLLRLFGPVRRTCRLWPGPALGVQPPQYNGAGASVCQLRRDQLCGHSASQLLGCRVRECRRARTEQRGA